MHMIATNICVWLHVLIQETKHQIMIMVSPNTTEHIPDGDLTKAWDRVDDLVEDIYDDYADSMSVQPSFHKSSAAAATSVGPKKAIVNMTLTTAASVVKATFMGGGGHNQYPMGHLHRPTRSLNDHYITHGECRRSNIIGELVTDASQFLFPCTIEYSLICAAILYIMWKNISDMLVFRSEMFGSPIYGNFFSSPGKSTSSRAPRCRRRRRRSCTTNDITTRWTAPRRTRVCSRASSSW